MSSFILKVNVQRRNIVQQKSHGDKEIYNKHNEEERRIEERPEEKGRKKEKRRRIDNTLCNNNEFDEPIQAVLAAVNSISLQFPFLSTCSSTNQLIVINNKLEKMKQ